MDRKLAVEIINCLPKGRTLYPYCKDYYALQLLGYFVAEGKKMSAIKQSRYAKLLNKELVKGLISRHGGRQLCSTHFDSIWVDRNKYFTLTLDLWNGNEAGWSQTSRRGWNLVLQLNFSNQHNSQYQKLVKPTEKQILNFKCHPIYQRSEPDYFRETLAWSRIDIDFEKNECLIEEIQSDWMRDVKYLLFDARFACKRKQKTINYWPAEGRPEDIIQYCELLEQQYASIWAEAMLSAVLYFVKSELGLTQVYYHSSESGYLVKGINGSKPPRSLYSKLPRAFCFEETSQAPGILHDDVRYKRLRRKRSDIRWFELGLL